MNGWKNNKDNQKSNNMIEMDGGLVWVVTGWKITSV